MGQTKREKQLFCSLIEYQQYLGYLDRMLFHHRITLKIDQVALANSLRQHPFTPLGSNKDTASVKCPAKEHNPMTLTRTVPCTWECCFSFSVSYYALPRE